MAAPRSDDGRNEVEMNFKNDENPQRGNWTGHMDFLFASVGAAVGLGNLWRFPYLCYKNGGGAFLVPYTIMLFILGIPVFLIDMVLGQFSAFGPVMVFKNCAPFMKGLGISMVLATIFVGIYYNVIVAWTVYYSYASMTSDLPWQYCNHDFNSKNCFSYNDYERCLERNNGSWWIYNHGRCINNRTQAQLIGVNETTPKHFRVSPSEEYYRSFVLNTSDGIENMGGIQWGLFASLFFNWLVIALSLIKGIKSSGKVVYFTATFPYFVLLVLLVRGLLLPGAMEGIRFYIVPEWSKLSDIEIWKSASVQMIYTLGLSSGGQITFSSYNKFHSNAIRDTFVVCLTNCLTSFLAGFVIFSVLGFLAHELDVPVPEVVTSQFGLAFVTYPDLVTRLPGAPFWSMLFFFMLFTLGLDSSFSLVENITTNILDGFPHIRSKKSHLVVSVCFILFLLGIPMTMQGGRYVIDLLDNYLAGWLFLLIVLSKLLVISWVYSVDSFIHCLRLIQNFKPGFLLKAQMKFVYGFLCPVLITSLLIFSWINRKVYASEGYVFPLWTHFFGVTVTVICISPIPLGILYNVILEQKGTLISRLRESSRPTDLWFKHSRLVFSSDKFEHIEISGIENASFTNPN